jgi:hypothetical protein
MGRPCLARIGLKALGLEILERSLEPLGDPRDDLLIPGLGWGDVGHVDGRSEHHAGPGSHQQRWRDLGGRR